MKLVREFNNWFGEDGCKNGSHTLASLCANEIWGKKPNPHTHKKIPQKHKTKANWQIKFIELYACARKILQIKYHLHSGIKSEFVRIFAIFYR